MYDNAIKYKNKGYLQDNSLEGRTRYLQQAETRNTDWFKELFQHSIRHQHTVSLSSGGQVSNFYASLGATIDPGWAKVQSENTYFFNLNATFKPHKYWTFGTIVNASYTRDHDGGDFTPLYTAQTLSRTLDPNQYYLYQYAPYNIKEEMRQNYRDVDAVNVRLQASIAYRPSEKFNASLLGSIQYYNDLTEFVRTEKSNVSERFRAMNKRLIRDRNSYLYKPAEDVYAVPRVVMPHGGYRTVQEYASRRFDLQARATYTDTFDDGKHALTLVGGSDLYDYFERNGWHNEYGVNFELGELSTFDPLLFRWLHDQRSNYYSRSTKLLRNVAFLGNLSYSFLSRYTLDASLRYEGTNLFGKSRLVRWIPTWNVALGWDLSSESFFHYLRPLSSLSTRLSYGMTGTLPSVYNSFQRIRGYLPFRPGELIAPSLHISEPANHDLTYEKMYELNWNLNFGLLQDRIGVSLSLYSRQGRDLVDVSYNQGTGGFFKPYGNVASMEAKGAELSLTTQNVRTKRFSWTTAFSYARNTNKVTKLLSQSDVSTLVSSSNFSATDHLDYLKYSGTLTPTDQGGINNSFRFGNFTLSAYILYSFGNVMRLPAQFSTTYYDYEVLGHEFNRRWKAPGDEEHTNVPSIPTADQRNRYPNLSQAYTTYDYSDVRIARSDYVQLRDVSLGYSLPKSVLSKTFLSSVDLKLQASNLFLIYADKKLNGALPYAYTPHSLIFTCTVGM